MRISTTKKFDKQFKKQSAKIKREFAKKVEMFLIDINNPLLHIHKLKGAYKGLWSLNVTSDVRVVFDKSYEPIIIFVAIGSHSELYS